MAENTTVMACDCKDADQDRMYGRGMRLHNKGFVKGKSNGKAYCTVCSSSNRMLRISFVFPKPNQFGPLDKDPTVTRKSKNYSETKITLVVKTTKKAA